MILDTNVSSSAGVAVAEVEEDSDILRECFGGCGKKILAFTFPTSEDWGEMTEGCLCLECRTKLMVSGSLT